MNNPLLSLNHKQKSCMDESNFVFQHHPIPGLFLHGIVYSLLFSLGFLSLVVFCRCLFIFSAKPLQADSSLVTFLLNPGVTSHSLLAAGSFSVLAKHF